MILAARESFAAAARRRGWTNPYVTDGLIAMWDGEWNAGGGKHTTDVLQMSPVVGDGVHMTVDPDYYGNTNVSITGNAVAVSGGGQFRLRDIATPTGELTLEYVVTNVTLGPAIYSTRFGSFCQLGGIGFYNQLSNGQTATTITRNGGFVAGNFFQAAFSTYAIVYNASNAVTRYVVNGAQKTLGTRTGTGTYTRGPNLTLGCQYGGSGVFFAARVYDRALTVAELASNYAIDKERFNTP